MWKRAGINKIGRKFDKTEEIPNGRKGKWTDRE